MKSRLYSDEFIIPSFLSQKYIPSLDGLRAVSIIIVILGHSNFTFQNAIIEMIAGGGNLGVHIFFIISGLLITTLLIKEKVAKNSIDLKSFYIRRSFRILPVAYLYILVVILLNYVFKIGITFKSFIHVLTFTENFETFTTVQWPIRHFWSLCVEEQFYLFFPLLLKINFKLYLNFMLVMLLLKPVFSYLIFHNADFDNTTKNIIFYIYSFLGTGLYSITIGSLMAIILCKYPVHLKANSKLVGLIQIVLLLAISFFGSQKLVLELSSVFESIKIAIFIFTTIYFTEQGFFRVLNNKFIKKIGLLSYSLYLWQQLFTGHQPWGNFSNEKYSLILNLIVMCCVAYASYTYFESPFLKLKHKFSQKKILGELPKQFTV